MNCAVFLDDHPTFVPKIKVGTSLADDFEIRYLGWGCLKSIGVTLVLKGSGDEVALPDFPFCEQWDTALR